MFKTLTRTLKLGLTAITILTAGGFAGTAFAQVTSGYWLSQSGAVLFPSGYPHYNQFLFGTVIPTANGLHNGDVSIPPIWHNLSLNLGTTTFKGRALGGSSADGVGYFSGRVGRNVRWYDYAGLFHTTDLGAPITGRSGKASWVGKLQAVNSARTEPAGGPGKDFVLEVDYTNQKLNAFVQSQYVDWYIKIDALYNNRGLITGDVEYSKFYSKDRDRRRQLHLEGRVSGLIGVQGAVGAFISDNSHSGYSGGFVARPAGDVGGAQDFLDRTCNRNAFVHSSKNQEFCRIEYVNARRETIKLCLESDGSINNDREGKCNNAARYNSCINDPFANKCTTDADFKEFYVSARATRLVFCNTAGNSGNSACTHPGVVTKLCNNNLFGTGCLSHSNYESRRIERAKTCAASRYSSGCSSVPITQVCSRVPFGTYCTSSSYASQRLARAKTCAASRYASGCTSSYGVTTSKICSLVPFGTYCTSSSYESYRVTRAKTCAANRYASGCSSSYGVTTSKVCSRVPFGSTCTSSSYESYRVTRAKTCAANRSASGCSSSYGVTTSKVCSRVPFGATCTSSTYESHRVTRAKICAANLYDSRCTTGQNVTRSKICSLVPFGAYCTSSAYESYRVTRAKICAANLRDSRCTTGQNITTSNICTRVPFGTACTSSSYESHRVARAKICAANLYDSRCTTGQNVTRSKICSLVPFGAYCTSSSYESHRIARAKICAANLYDLRCTTGQNITPLKICSLVPFGAYCTSSTYQSYRVTRAKICAANLSDSRCTTGQNITASKVCTLVPFGTACSSDTYESHRIARAKVCAVNLRDSRCTTGQNITTSNICTRVPFVGVCVDDDNFDDERTSRLEFCDIATNSNHPNCTDTNLSNICNYAPFSPVCLKHSGSITKRTDSKFTACRATGPIVLTCYGVRQIPSTGLKPDAATWVDGFVTKANPGGLSSVVDINRGSQFVKAGKTNLDQTGIHLVHRSATLLRAGDTTDGVGFLWGETRTGSQIFVAGILAETDLGAPLREEAKTSVVWRGEFQSLRYDTKTDFDLQINFGPNGAGSIEAFIERKIGEYDFVNTPHYYLDGRFDANGLITGRVIAGRFVHETPTTGTDYAYQGVLRGIIGEDGAVGAFVGGKSRDNGITFHTAGHFAGGFIAAPADVVEYADWVENPSVVTTRTSPLTNQFLAGSDGTVGNGSIVTITFENASYGDKTFNGDRNDGVQLFSNPTGTVTNVYAGILTTTNLGAPLDATTAQAVWEGQLFASLATDAPAYEVADFTPTIDFNEGLIYATATGVTQSDGTAVAGSVLYTFSADFDARGVFNNGEITRSSRGRASTGELTGLIGVEGAVGAFISNPGARVSYAGGFIARPTP